MFKKCNLLYLNGPAITTAQLALTRNITHPPEPLRVSNYANVCVTLPTISLYNLLHLSLRFRPVSSHNAMLW